MSFTFKKIPPHKPHLQASSSPIPGIRIFMAYGSNSDSLVHSLPLMILQVNHLYCPAMLFGHIIKVKTTPNVYSVFLFHSLSSQFNTISCFHVNFRKKTTTLAMLVRFDLVFLITSPVQVLLEYSLFCGHNIPCRNGQRTQCFFLCILLGILWAEIQTTSHNEKKDDEMCHRENSFS